MQGAVDVVRQREGIQGVVAAVITPSGRWTMASGESYAGVPMRPDHVLAIGSNTKTLTTLVLMRLREQGRLNLDDRVTRFLAPMANVDTTITLRQLMHHSSGLGEYAGGPMYRDSVLARATRVWTPPELVPMIPAPQFAPGTSWTYCNSNFLIAGMIAERVGGASLTTLLHNEVTTPLGLDSTRFAPQEPLVGVLAHRWIGGQDYATRPLASEWSAAWAAGAVLSTAGEMAELYDGLFHGRVITQASLDEMLQFSGPESYGLGISRKTVGGQTVIGHTGEIRGFTSVSVWVPSISSVVVVLANAMPATPLAVADTLIRELVRTTVGVTQGPPTPAGIGLRMISANPSSDSMRMAFTMPRDGEAELAVFAVGGRRVRTLARGTFAAGVHEVVWDGRDDDGAMTAPGTYWVRVTGPNLRGTRRIVRLR